MWLFLFPPNRYRRQKYGRNKQTQEGDFALFIPTGEGLFSIAVQANLIPCIITHYVSHFGLWTVTHNRQLILYRSRLFYISLWCVSILLHFTMFYFYFYFSIHFIFIQFFNDLSYPKSQSQFNLFYAFVLYLSLKDSGSRAEQFAIWSGALASRRQVYV